jgi:hypothetical protein
MSAYDINSILATIDFIHQNKDELTKNLSAYEHLLHTLKKAADEQSKKLYSKDWEARKDYTPQESAAIKKYIDDGYSPREAERLAGAHQGPKNYKAALQSGINPSMPSDKMMGSLKGLAKEWLDSNRSRDLAQSDAIKNPLKHASGQMEQAHQKHTGNYHEAYSDFLSSDDVKNLSPRDRHKAVSEWKNKWKQNNPDYEEGLTSNISQTQSKFADAAKNIEHKNQEAAQHIALGGAGDVHDMTDQEAMQHLSGSQNDEGYSGGSIIKDPAADFAAKNPRYIKILNQEQMDRVKRIDAAAAAQGKTRTPSQPQEQSASTAQPTAQPAQSEAAPRIKIVRAGQRVKNTAAPIKIQNDEEE